jgi:hypothetical protein
VTATAQRRRRPFLDRPIARVIAAVVFLGCVASIGYLEREWLWPGAVERTAADDPFARCFAERSAEIDRMLAEDLIQAGQAELFKSRAEAMCRAQTPGPGAGTPALPGQ